MVYSPRYRESFGTVTWSPALGALEIPHDSLVDCAKIVSVPRHDSMHKVTASVQGGILQLEI